MDDMRDEICVCFRVVLLCLRKCGLLLLRWLINVVGVDYDLSVRGDVNMFRLTEVEEAYISI